MGIIFQLLKFMGRKNSSHASDIDEDEESEV